MSQRVATNTNLMQENPRSLIQKHAFEVPSTEATTTSVVVEKGKGKRKTELQEKKCAMDTHEPGLAQERKGYR